MIPIDFLLAGGRARFEQLQGEGKTVDVIDDTMQVEAAVVRAEGGLCVCVYIYIYAHVFVCM